MFRNLSHFPKPPEAMHQVARRCLRRGHDESNHPKARLNKDIDKTQDEPNDKT